MEVLEKGVDMERVQRIKNVRLNEVPRRFRALEMPQETMIEEIIIIVKDVEEAKPKKTTKNKWAEELAKEIKELNMSEEVGEYIRACSREIRENAAFRHDLIEENN